AVIAFFANRDLISSGRVIGNSNGSAVGLCELLNSSDYLISRNAGRILRNFHFVQVRSCPLLDFGVVGVNRSAKTDGNDDNAADQPRPKMDDIEKLSCFLP